MDQPPVSVIILGWREDEALRRCLKSIAEARNDTPSELVLVLNGAVPEVYAVAREHADHLTLVESPVNLGFGGGCNLGASVSQARYLLFLNDDTEVQDGWVDGLVAAAEADERVGAVGCRLVDGRGLVEEMGATITPEGWGSQRHHGERPEQVPLPPEPFQTDYCSAAALLVRRDAFASIGGFDPRYHPAYFEDLDLCVALLHRGWLTVCQPSVTVTHYGGSSTDSTFREFLGRRNHAAFVKKWSWPAATPTRWGDEEEPAGADELRHLRLDVLVHRDYTHELRQRLDQLEQVQLHPVVTELERERDEARQALDEAHQRITQDHATMEDLSARLERFQSHIDGLQALVDHLEAQLARTWPSRLAARLRTRR